VNFVHSKFFRHLFGITKLDKEKNKCIRGKKNWGTQHSKGNKTISEKLATTRTVQRNDTNRIPKQEIQYRRKGRSNIGRPRKRWRDQIHLEEKEQETRLTLHENNDDDDDDDDVNYV
jgi:hypothetical protein